MTREEISNFIEDGDIVTDYDGNEVKGEFIPNNVYVIQKPYVELTVVYTINHTFDLIDRCIIEPKYTAEQYVDGNWIPWVTEPTEIDDFLLEEGQILRFSQNDVLQCEITIGDVTVYDDKCIFAVITDIDSVAERASDILDSDDPLEAEADVFDVPLSLVPAGLLVEYYLRYGKTVMECKKAIN